MHGLELLDNIINRPGVAGAVLQTPLSLIDSLGQSPILFLKIFQMLIMAQMARVLVFFHKIAWLCRVLRILNLEGHQNCIIGSEVMTILTMFFVHD